MIPVNIPVTHKQKGGDAVEGRHEKVGQSEVNKEVIGDTPHRSVSCLEDELNSKHFEGFVFV